VLLGSKLAHLEFPGVFTCCQLRVFIATPKKSKALVIIVLYLHIICVHLGVLPCGRPSRACSAHKKTRNTKRHQQGSKTWHPKGLKQDPDFRLGLVQST
jgi:hypothetical protein